MSEVNKHILITGLLSLLIELVERIGLLICTLLITRQFFLRFNGNFLRFVFRIYAGELSIAMSRFSYMYLEKFSLNFSSFSFVTRVNLLHP